MTTRTSGLCYPSKKKVLAIPMEISQQQSIALTICSITFISSVKRFIIVPFGVTSKNRLTGAHIIRLTTSSWTFLRVLLIIIRRNLSLTMTKKA